MKIILKKDVHGLGYKDEVLTVKDGYGRNYLLPQGLAVLATEKALKHHRHGRHNGHSELRCFLFGLLYLFLFHVFCHF